MKKFNLSLVAVLAMSTFAIAGGDIAPVEEPVVVVEPVVESTGAFYLGAAYGLLSADAEETFPGGNLTYDTQSDDFSQFMLQAGYKFNDYVAVEGRYWIGMDDNSWDHLVHGGVTAEIDTWGIYVKPMYPVTESFDVYALLGYADADYTISGSGYTLDADAFDGFSWGIGADYSFTDSVSVFVDYVSLYDDTYVNNAGNNVDFTIDTWNFGVAYNF
ncbi:outer membrane protein [Sulfurovum sp. CS9]|uniref:outer membrane protein n=1 Tax=Sulfurovum sp. CS9 TaxID=3391146 RepID=UPI0039ED3233